MESYLKLQILEIKSLNHFLVREYETNESQRFKRLEKVLQKSYSSKNKQSHQRFRAGSYVAVYMNRIDTEKAPKLWMRGIVRENYNQKDFLYGICFADYGFDKTCHKSDLRQLLPHLYPDFVPFQTFDFYLTAVEHKKGVNKELVLKEIRHQFESNNFIVWATVEHKDRQLGSTFGSISIEEDCDLAAILIDKELANDVHFCGRNQIRSIENRNYFDIICQTFGSTSGQRTAPVPTRDLMCKCVDIIKLRRKRLRLELNRTKVMGKTSDIKYSQSI